MIELDKYNKNSAKDKWELPVFIPLMTIVGVNHYLSLLYLFKMMIHIYTTEKTIHQFAICYMINPSLRFNKIFITQVKKCSGFYSSIRKIKTI